MEGFFFNGKINTEDGCFTERIMLPSPWRADPPEDAGGEFLNSTRLMIIVKL
jgi:hypothetical protein